MSNPQAPEAETIYSIILRAGDVYAAPAFYPDEAMPALADAIYRLGREGIITDWTLTPAGLTLTFAPDGARRVQQMSADLAATEQPPLCEYCHTRHYGYQDHHLA